MGAIRLDRLRKVHPNGHVAVDEVNLDIADGEFFALLGPSGCGKTTLLRMIAGLDEPTSGDVLLDGESLRDVGTRDRHLGMLFQSSAVYPHLTVRENLAFPLVVANAGRRVIATRVAEMAELVGLTDVLDLRPRRLSGGMQQRVAMGRALMRRPPLLLMDEPMSNLDAKLRTELRGELAALQRWSGATTVYVTHDQVEAMALADRVAVMRHGRIVQCGTPMELYLDPIDLFVATFVGSPAMNVLHGRLDERDGRWFADLGSQRLAVGPPERWQPTGLQLGEQVAVGVRPTALTLATTPDETTLTVEVTRVEYLGTERLVTAATEARRVEAGDGPPTIGDATTAEVTALLTTDVEVDLWRPVHFRVDTDQVHLFDPHDGRRFAQRGTRSTSAPGSTS